MTCLGVTCLDVLISVCMLVGSDVVTMWMGDADDDWQNGTAAGGEVDEEEAEGKRWTGDANGESQGWCCSCKWRIEFVVAAAVAIWVKKKVSPEERKCKVKWVTYCRQWKNTNGKWEVKSERQARRQNSLASNETEQSG